MDKTDYCAKVINLLNSTFNYNLHTKNEGKLTSLVKFDNESILLQKTTEGIGKKK